MAGLDDLGGLFNINSVNPKSVSFATVKQALLTSVANRGRMFIFFQYRLCLAWLILVYEDFLVP